MLSRAGFVARGLIYGIIGVLALKLALGHGGKLTNQQGALHTVAHQPFGKVLLTLVAIGLGGYSLWRLVRAAIGHGPEGTRQRLRPGRGARRAGSSTAACARSRSRSCSARGGGSAASPKKATAGVFGWPAGTWIVGIAGAVLIGVALYQAYRGHHAEVPRRLEDRRDERDEREVDHAGSGTVGHLARMVVFALVGIFLIKAAVDYNARAAVGLDGALAKIVHRSYGPLALGVVAAGLIAFALYSLSDARYRKI